MVKITDEFEKETEEDSENVKKQRFERVLDYMQDMQELGHPPKEIVGELVSTGNYWYLRQTCSEIRIPKQAKLIWNHCCHEALYGSYLAYYNVAMIEQPTNACIRTTYNRTYIPGTCTWNSIVVWRFYDIRR